MKKIIKQVVCTLSNSCDQCYCEYHESCNSPMKAQSQAINALRDQLKLTEAITTEVRKDLAEVRKLLKAARSHRYDE